MIKQKMVKILARAESLKENKIAPASAIAPIIIDVSYLKRGIRKSVKKQPSPEPDILKK
jgi:hypothetical protein